MTAYKCNFLSTVGLHVAVQYALWTTLAYMSTTKAYTPAQAAQLLSVHPNTVRQWCSQFADVLSESATARPRLLRESDIAVLQIAAQLRSEGISVADVLLRLQQLPVADRQSPTIDATATHVDATTAPTNDAVMLPATDIGAILTDLAVMVDGRVTQVDERLRSVDERLSRVESQRSMWFGVAIGVALGVALGVIIAAILLRL